MPINAKLPAEVGTSTVTLNIAYSLGATVAGTDGMAFNREKPGAELTYRTPSPDEAVVPKKSNGITSSAPTVVWIGTLMQLPSPMNPTEDEFTFNCQLTEVTET